MMPISSNRWGRGPGFRRNLRARYEAMTLEPRAKQAPRRTPVRWYPIPGYQHDRPSLLQAPSLPVARATPKTWTRRRRTRNRGRGPAVVVTLDSGSHINAPDDKPESRAQRYGGSNARDACLDGAELSSEVRRVA